MLIPRDLKYHPVIVVAVGRPALNGLLAYVGFTVAPLGPQTNPVVIFLVSGYIMEIDILIVGTSPILVP